MFNIVSTLWMEPSGGGGSQSRVRGFDAAASGRERVRDTGRAIPPAGCTKTAPWTANPQPDPSRIASHGALVAESAGLNIEPSRSARRLGRDLPLGVNVLVRHQAHQLDGNTASIREVNSEFLAG